ncbi:hypothetical protein DYB25_004194 [Aphanomyces astaci]|uniref:FAD-binding FR-type domain-containing protein n=1 Tax=Aphanomyces astaci TaxID=112090 RepID=A0A397AV57_APHAT|nr:hypothetical protein DYB25_004194 [Aphanomyces astaci]
MHVGIIVAYYANINSLVTLLPCWDCDLASAEGTDRWQNVFGFLAFICVGVVALTSLPYVRRNHYEVFRTAHFLFVPAAIFASMHRVPILYSVFASLVLYLINHMYSRETTRAPISVARATAMPADVIELTFHTTTHYAPGGTVWVRVPALSHSQWHPFSIASSPLHTPGLVTIYVKCLGNWTTGLYHYIQECKRKRFPPLMYLDGGSAFTASRTTMVPSAYRHVLFIAGGIGVTVLMGQITHALYTPPHKTVWLVWHVRQSEMLLQFHDWLRDLEALASMNGSRLYIRLHVTRDPLAIFNVSDHHKGIVPCFDVHAKPVEATPQANLSFARRTWMALLAFVCSGGLLTLALYGNALQTAQGNYWPLQRFVACCAVVGGCAVAYFVVSAASSVLPSQQLPVDMTTLPPKPATDTVLFLLKYNVQTIRVDWTVLLNEIQQQIALDDMVGVFVSGPKPLIRDVDDNIQGRPTFHVHHHHFLI